MEQHTPPTAVGSNDELAASWRGEVAPTHRCKVCGALWRYWPKRDTGHEDSWNLRSTIAGQCCDTAPMGEQIEPLTIGRLAEWLSARLAVDTMTQHLFGPKPGDPLQ
jgi:hypothetical protein